MGGPLALTEITRHPTSDSSPQGGGEARGHMPKSEAHDHAAHPLDPETRRRHRRDPRGRPKPSPAPRSIPARCSPATCSSPSGARPATATTSCAQALAQVPAWPWWPRPGPANSRVPGRCWPCRGGSKTPSSTPCGRSAAASRERTARQGRRRHRLGRQDRHQGGAAPRALGAGRDARLHRLLQQPLGRAPHPGRACPPTAAYGVFEIGMNHAGRDRAARRHGPARHRPRDHGRAGPYRALRLALGHRRRQGRDLLRAEARRRRDHQPRQPGLSPPARPCPGLEGRPRGQLRRARGGRRPRLADRDAGPTSRWWMRA